MTGTYRIRIKGHLDPSWGEWLDNVTLTHQPNGITVLTGSIEDQPALIGLLNKIHSLGLPLLSVERLEQEIDLD